MGSGGGHFGEGPFYFINLTFDFFFSLFVEEQEEYKLTSKKNKYINPLKCCFLIPHPLSLGKVCCNARVKAVVNGRCTLPFQRVISDKS